MDPSLYKNPEQFDGLRFFDESNEENALSLAAPNSGYLFFGYGSHAW
jgi:cytochrome P450